MKNTKPIQVFAYNSDGLLGVYFSISIGPLATKKSGKISTTCVENYFRNIGDMLFVKE
jgi:hypothetical protein